MTFRGRKRDRESTDFYWESISDMVILCGMLGREISLLLYLRMKEERQMWGRFQNYMPVMPLFSYMMLAVTVATMSFLGQEEVLSVRCYHETNVCKSTLWRTYAHTWSYDVFAFSYST